MSAASNATGNRNHNADADGRNRLFPRRDSIAIAGQDFQNVLVEKLAELRSIWDEVGMTEEQRRERMQTALGHLKTLLVDMVDEEVVMRNTLYNNYVTARDEVEALSHQLHEPKPASLFEGNGTHTLLQLEEYYRKLKERLTEEKNQRIQEREHLTSEHDMFATCNGVGQYVFNKNEIPTAEELDNLKRENAQLKKRWETNFAIYENRRLHISQLSKKLDLTAETLTQFQRDILSGKDVSVKNNVVLSGERMSELYGLEELVQKKYEAYLADIRQRVGAVKKVLVDWWDQCHVPQTERELFHTVDPEVDPELAVHQYTEAINYWRSFYEARKPILDKVGEWESLWKQHVEFEEGDVNRFYNRGGGLLLEEKRRKKVQAMLPQVYKELKTMVTEYDNEHDAPFVMGGLPLMEYIDSIEESYQEKKRKEKEEKEMLKKQQLMNERLYGTASATPGVSRKRFGSVNAPTPSSPSGKGLTASHSKPFTHSSLANLRSPIPKGGTSSLTKKPPPGPSGQSHKRKILAEHLQEIRGVPNQAVAAAAGIDNRTLSSAGSYGDFANDLRSKGVEVQSSFINGQEQPHPSSPKIARFN